MSGCLDGVHCECGIDLADKRNGIASVTSGILVGDRGRGTVRFPDKKEIAADAAISGNFQ